MFYQLRFFNPSASESLISTQAGIIVGSKTAAQVCTGMLWGRLADSEYGGRKTVLMIGLLCSGMSLTLLPNENLCSRYLMHWVWTIEIVHLCCGMAGIRRCYEQQCWHRSMRCCRTESGKTVGRFLLTNSRR